MPEEQVGQVNHFFGRLMVAAVVISAGSIRVGDRLRFAGHTTDFESVVNSMQEEHQPIDRAGPGQNVGIQVPERARVGDMVFKIT